MIEQNGQNDQWLLRITVKTNLNVSISMAAIKLCSSASACKLQLIECLPLFVSGLAVGSIAKQQLTNLLVVFH